ncbi:ABC transporter ATP-binding protein [Opitutus terrae]|uniref:Spermidine/putrescine import ATP-binding protein PotA n=1 Tax=Opitutus terrae (strain DSM 11246 / JCM 15787 / PB90-1) TaxID=452637 RepID=B1ZYH3_OPITP|nr:ABC transporter ATP-binding protein [Opitutus terrae]ACB77071.1 spermidine/putrescine ABC transporter ATPase subunit [Opitutus terrae PB90-1]
MNAMVELHGVTRRFGAVAAVDNVSLQIAAGEFLTLLGPSGCGKTTLLRLIAGFDTPTSGEVWIEGTDVSRLPPYRRPVNQVFQSYALFPHLTVAENVGFGLKMQRVPKAEAAERVRQTLELVSLTGLDARRPHQLSGGQKQRVALARALVCRPKVLLLDEPLSALDAKLRLTMQLELKRLQRQLGITFVFVTHDQEEALTMSDRIAVVNRGRIEQLDTAPEIYHRPATPFVADFVGQGNLLAAERVAMAGFDVRVRLAGGLEVLVPANNWPMELSRALISIRPEKVHVSRLPIAASNSFAVEVKEEVFRGATDHLVLVTDIGTRLNAVVANESELGDIFHAGDSVFCALHPDDLVVVRAE